MTTQGHSYRPDGGLITTSPEPAFRDFYGLPVSMQYLYGSLRSDDGRYFWPIRGSYRDRARHLHLAAAGYLAGKDGALDQVDDFEFAVGTGEGYEGPVDWDHRGGRWGVYRSDGAPIIETDNHGVWWHEGSRLRARGAIDGPGLQFRVSNPQWPFVYSSRLFRVSDAVIDGVQVSGWIFHDTLHLPAGEHFLTSPYQRGLQAAWVAFVTEFEDGAVHCGHLVYGLNGFSILIVHRSDGPPVISNDVKIEAELGDHDFCRKVTYRAGGETWVWDAYPGEWPYARPCRDRIRSSLEPGRGSTVGGGAVGAVGGGTYGVLYGTAA